MKSLVTVLVFCAAALPARALNAGFWAPEITPETLASFRPAPAAAGKAATAEEQAFPGPGEGIPHDGLNYSAAEEMLIKEFGVTGIKLDIPEAEVSLQMNNPANRLPFDQAFRFTLQSFFEDHSDPASPLATVLAGMGASASKPAKHELTQAKQKLRQLMNLPGSALVIVRAGGPNQASRGESVSENWVSLLKLGRPGRSHWGIVERAGKTPAYNYGLVVKQ